MTWRIDHGDCLDVMAGMPEASVDAIVTDPPYGLGFMGKAWDALPPGIEWAEACLRVLKPGGYMLAFGGTRTYHRLACAIEDAGFEIRDSLTWSHMAEVFCRCAPVPYSQHGDDDVRGVWPGVPDVPEADPAREGPDVLPSMQRPTPWPRVGEARAQGSTSLDGRQPGELHPEDERPAQPCVEGRRDVHTEGGQLPADQVRPGAGVGASDGPQGRLPHGASAPDGVADRPSAGADGGRASHRPRSDEQRADEPRAMAVEWIAQGGGAWPGCPGCGKPLEPPFDAGPLAWYYGSGFPKGKACLKPAHEPIVLARKPAPRMTALNVDECRIAASSDDVAVQRARTGGAMGVEDGRAIYGVGQRRPAGNDGGRWPANVILDEEAAAILDAQTGVSTSTGGQASLGAFRGGSIYGKGRDEREARDPGYGDTGGASRFYYCAKASTRERNAGLDGFEELRSGVGDHRASGDMNERLNRGRPPVMKRNTHATVKPVSLMRWLTRLITPEGGTVLDPMCGSGTTGIAARLEGFSFIGIEREAEYVAIARARVAHWEPEPVLFAA